jgi:hypothetical protein
MSNTVPGLFNRAVFVSGQEAQRRNAAAQGLSQTFATILSSQMRQTAIDGDDGPLGTEGGASGDIYGGFMDTELAKLIAKSPAMKSLNGAIERELARPGNQASATTSKGKALVSNKIEQTIFPPEAADNAAVPLLNATEASPLSQFGALGATGADHRGPLLLPPAPDPLAPDLPAPTGLKG